MADEQPSLQIDTDWKKQAQEEKKRLAEKAAKDAQSPPAAAAAGPSSPAAGTASPRGSRGARGRDRRELPPASIGTLAHSLMTQTLYYLGDVAYQGGDPVANLDMAKHQIDTLKVLDEKTANNLSDEERHALDLALHETSTRFISIASQFI